MYRAFCDLDTGPTGGVGHPGAAPRDEGEPARAPPAALGAYVQVTELSPQMGASAKPTEQTSQAALWAGIR